MFYELLGTFNDWGNSGSLEPYRFTEAIVRHFEVGERFKIRFDNRWFGYECLSANSSGRFSSAPDGFGGCNIYVDKAGDYVVAVSGDRLTIQQSKIVK